MDDLTRIRGIGAATAARLAQAGAGSFAALAVARAEDLAVHPALRGLRASPGDLAAWIAAAAALAGDSHAPSASDSPEGDAPPADRAEAPQPPRAASPVPPAGGAAPAGPAPRPEGWLVVTGPPRGFRRAGRQFGPVPVRIALADLTEAEIAAIAGEPMLRVETEATDRPDDAPDDAPAEPPPEGSAA